MLEGILTRTKKQSGRFSLCDFVKLAKVQRQLKSRNPEALDQYRQDLKSIWKKALKILVRIPSRVKSVIAKTGSTPLENLTSADLNRLKGANAYLLTGRVILTMYNSFCPVDTLTKNTLERYYKNDALVHGNMIVEKLKEVNQRELTKRELTKGSAAALLLALKKR